MDSYPPSTTNWFGVCFAAFLVFALLTLIAFAVYNFRWYAKRGRLRMAREVLRSRIRLLAAEFPDEVAAWGGAKALENADHARAVLRALEREGAERPA